MTISMSTPAAERALSEEQQAIVQSRSEALRVLAFAGTGKTTTLRAYAQARPQQRMLYLAFNRSVAQEARGSFGPHVSCSTIHGLAYRAVGHRFQHKLRNSLRAHQVAAALGLSCRARNDLGLADRALRVLQHFLCSASPDLFSFASSVVPAQRYQQQAVKAAARLWELMADPQDGRVPMLHDGYLKLYQLSRPRLRFDVILLDEAQDTNPVTLAILAEQPCARVFVGDPHQQIYQFRHATNAMAAAGTWDELALTGSFRFGEEIAAAANRLLSVKGEKRQLRGLRSTPAPATKAFLARGNAALFKQAVELVQAGEQLHWCGGLSGYRHDLLLDLWHLQQENRGEIQDRFIASFERFDDLMSYAEAEEVRDIRAWGLLLERRESLGSIPELIAALRRHAVQTLVPGVTAMATAHKSKGLEFGSVQIADDFHALSGLEVPFAEVEDWEYGPSQAPLLWDGEGYRGAVVAAVEEVNISYVAVTRAQGSCTSALWGAPLFNGLAQYLKDHPRYLLVESFEVLKPKKQHAAAVSAEAVVDPESGALEGEVPRVPTDVLVSAGEPAAVVAATPVPAAGAPAVVGTELTLVWFQGALAASHVEVVTSHYARKYPLLRWEWLLQSCSEERVVTNDPAGVIEALAEAQQLGSAQALFKRFLLDLGLVQQVSGVDQLTEAVVAGEDQQEGSAARGVGKQPGRYSMRKQLAGFWSRVSS
jgi:F-box protein, helicase, 18